MKFTCVQCAGQIQIPTEDPFSRCPFCGSTLFLDHASSFRHLGLPASVSATGAMDLLKEEAETREQPLPAPVKLDPVLLPFWGVRGESLQETIPAFSPWPLPLASFRMPASRCEWFRAEDYPGFASVPPSADSNLAWRDREDVSSFSLYSIPFYRVRYGGGDRPFEAYVDGVAGKIFWGTAPPGGTGRAGRRFTAVVGGIVALFALEAFLLPGFLLPGVVLAVTGAVLLPWVRRSLWPGRSP